MGDENNPELLAKILKILVNRYSNIINEKEQKTVGEIKAMITKNDLTIQSIVQSFAGEGYSYPENYAKAAEKCFNFVRDEITTFEPDIGISYWLTPKEIVSEKVADDEDKAIFLCSLLYSLGDENAEVVIAEMENGLPHAFVVTTLTTTMQANTDQTESKPAQKDEAKLQNNFCILDPCQEADFKKFCGQKHEVLDFYTYKKSKIKKFLYRFNSSKYEQYSDKDE
jgi:hypothetical protein